MKREYLQANGFIAEVIRTSRVKSADIKVEECAVSVVVPWQLPVERIEKLLKDKNRWIKEKLLLQREALPVSNKDYVSGEAFCYLGSKLPPESHSGRFSAGEIIAGATGCKQCLTAKTRRILSVMHLSVGINTMLSYVSGTR